MSGCLGSSKESVRRQNRDAGSRALAQSGGMRDKQLLVQGPLIEQEQPDRAWNSTFSKNSFVDLIEAYQSNNIYHQATYTTSAPLVPKRFATSSSTYKAADTC